MNHPPYELLPPDRAPCPPPAAQEEGSQLGFEGLRGAARLPLSRGPAGFGLPAAGPARPMSAADVLGIWVEQTEGANFWLTVCRPENTPPSRHPHRGDRRREGMSEALVAVFP